MKTLKKIGSTTLLVVLFALLSSVNNNASAQHAHYINPPWAPAYYPSVRYYYLPDIDVYYDLVDQDFIYLDDGIWQFSPVLPPFYDWYDLYNGFVVVLDVNVFQPWLHNQYYVSHYPRYYYRKLYDRDDIARIRGFNENARQPLYLAQRDRDRGRSDEFRQRRYDNNIQPGRNRANESRARSNNNPIERRDDYSRPPQGSNYHGKHTERPAHAQPQMRQGHQGGGRHGH